MTAVRSGWKDSGDRVARDPTTQAIATIRLACQAGLGIYPVKNLWKRRVLRL